MKSLRFIAFWIVTLMPAMTPLSNAQQRTAILSDKAVWSYVFAKPTVKNWTMQYPLPKGGYNVGEMHTNKNWQKNKPNVWMTAKVTLPADYKPGNLFLQYRYDDNIAISINGKPVFQAIGYCEGTRRDLFPSREKRIPNELVPGDNFVAVYCQNTGGDGFALVTLRTDEDPPLDIKPVIPVGGNWSYTCDDPGQQWTTRFPLPKSKLSCGVFCTLADTWDRKKHKIWMTQIVTLPKDYVAEEMLVQYLSDDSIYFTPP